MEEMVKVFDPFDWDGDEEGWYDAAQEVDAAAQDDTQRFTIRDDNAAEWALKKIRTEDERYARLRAVCEAQVEFYTRKIAEYDRQLERRTGYLQSLLEGYFSEVDHKRTKTQESYELPSGKLVLKHQRPKVTRDDELLADWCMMNGHEAEVEYVTKINWADLKGKLTETATGYVDENGEIVPGITLEEREDVFRVETGKE